MEIVVNTFNLWILQLLLKLGFSYIIWLQLLISSKKNMTTLIKEEIGL